MKRAVFSNNLISFLAENKVASKMADFFEISFSSDNKNKAAMKWEICLYKSFSPWSGKEYVPFSNLPWV
jgi:hypothetical protein